MTAPFTRSRNPPTTTRTPRQRSRRRLRRERLRRLYRPTSTLARPQIAKRRRNTRGGVLPIYLQGIFLSALPPRRLRLAEANAFVISNRKPRLLPPTLHPTVPRASVVRLLSREREGKGADADADVRAIRLRSGCCNARHRAGCCRNLHTPDFGHPSCARLRLRLHTLSALRLSSSASTTAFV